MKKFQYNLQSVLEYKQRILDDLKEQYAVRMKFVEEKKLEIRNLRAKADALTVEFDEVKKTGAAIEKFLMYSSMIDNLDKQVEMEKEALKILQANADKKKDEVVAANIDVNKFVKLKEKKQMIYKAQEQKDQEAFIDEFVSNQANSIGRSA
ncbi:flagellar export protein FliJ [Oribacterium sp. KHPX15]|uniref:flagellar export protein FliJ n=1 Tax=Oribacterium sp. KHPX15 TaxID=1855342 RepID=UPI00089CA179|nr:flagellar FliJ family protein [Oribacterium sp. KHPX15]SEA42049.1 flagellar export protein FliJ [Oribacterium sp. KHPX15]